MPTKLLSKIVQAFGAILILGLTAVAFEPRLLDLKLAYDYVTGQIARDIYSLRGEEVVPATRPKDRSTSELKQDLLSFDTETRHQAIAKIVEKKDTSFIPLLIKLFNDVSSVDSGDAGQKVTTADVAQEALARLYRENVIRDPGNLRIFIPLFDAASRGTRPEQLHSIQLLADLKEPLALKLLNDLSKNSSDKAVIIAASKALKEFDEGSLRNARFESINSRQTTLLSLIVFTCVLLGLFVVWIIVRSFDARQIMLTLLAISISLGMAILVNAEIERVAGLAPGSIRGAATGGHPILIRSKIYAENSQYPGDSLVSQEMVKICDIRTLKSLGMVSETEPDDLPNYRRLLETSRNWIASRLIFFNLDKPCLEDIFRNADEQLCDEIIRAIDKSGVSSDRLLELLSILSSSEKHDCSENIFRCYENMKKRPAWEY